MADVTQAGRVVPNPRIPKVMGILNIVFASCLLIIGLCMGAITLMQPYLNKAMADVQKKADAAAEKKHQADLKAIDEQEKVAETDAEKQALKAERQAIEARPKTAMPPTFDFNKLRLSDPRLTAYTWVDVTTALILNILMLAGGIGLVQRKLWGLSLSIWTYVAKITRLVLVNSYFALAIVPVLSQTLGKLVGEMMMQQQQAMGRPTPAVMSGGALVQIYYVTYTAFAVAMILFGSIYPVVGLWLLTRPGARAACDESMMPAGQELNETW
jgi:hypothetical protein